jgi:type IV pilus modification protein PilV
MGKLNSFDRSSRSARLGTTVAARRSRERGVSLIEVIIALAVLGFGMLAMAAAQISAYRFSDSSRERTLAHGLAQQQIEIFQSMSTDSIEAIRLAGSNDPLNPIDPDPNDTAAMAFNRSWTITPDTPETDVYTILVTINWAGNAGAQTLQLETFKSEN